jgi:hypothetical protein
MMRIWKETWYGDKQKYWNQAKCELKKGSFESYNAKITHIGSVYILKSGLLDVPQGIPRFVNGRTTHALSQISRVLPPSGWLGLGDILIF